VKPLAACALVVMALAWFAPWAAAQSGGQPAPQPAPKPVSGAKATAGAREAGRPHSLELTASVLWLAPSSLGTRDAVLTSNNTAGSPYALFTASGNLESAAGLEARVSYRLTRMFAIEGGVTYGRPGLSYTIANDAEGAAGFTAAGETVSQFFIDASFVAYLSKRGFAGGRLKPFVAVGGGFLQELHGQAGVASSYYSSDSGQVYHVGGGARYYFRQSKSGAVRAYGLRFDARYYIRNGGFSFDDGATTTFAAGGGLVIAF
jgi:hypothetical protein